MQLLGEVIWEHRKKLACFGRFKQAGARTRTMGLGLVQ